MFGLLAMPTVSAPRDAASRRQPTVNGVVPLAATAISASLLADRVLLDERGGLLGLVLGAFDGAQQRVAPAGHQQHQTRAPAS